MSATADLDAYIRQFKERAKKVYNPSEQSSDASSIDTADLLSDVSSNHSYLKK